VSPAHPLPATQPSPPPPPPPGSPPAPPPPHPPRVGRRERSDVQLSWNVRSPGHAGQHAATPPARQPSLLTSAIPHVLRKNRPSRRPDPHFLLKKCGFESSVEPRRLCRFLRPL